MYKYKISIKKVSGMLKESVLPKKNLVIKSKVERTTRGILKEAAKYLLENYGLELRDAGIEEVAKPKRKAPLQKERFTTEELLSLCKERGHGDLEYSGYRTTPDGRKYELKVSSVATGGRRVWVWTGSPTVNLNAKAVALYDVKTKTWQKKRNKFIEIVD